MSKITLNIVEPGTNLAVPNTGLFTHGIGGSEATIITVSILAVLAVVAAVLYYRKKHNKNSKLTNAINVVKSKKQLSIPLVALALVVSLGTLAGLLVNAGKSDTNAADGSLTVTEGSEDLTIEVGDEPVFAVLPVELTVEEATDAGYTLAAYTDSTDIVSTTNPDNVIPMIATSEDLSALTNNTWGLSLEPASQNDEAYAALSTSADSPTILKTIDDYTETPTDDTTTIYYGFYITPDTPYGIYTSSDIRYEAKESTATVIYNSNGLYFNDDEEQTTNIMKYAVDITENTEKVSRTPNIDFDGNADRLEYDTITNNVVTIPGASKLHAIIKYGTYDNTWDYLSFWQGSHPEYTAKDNYSEGIKECGDTTSDGRFAGNYNDPVTMECDIPGDSVTFGFWSQPAGGPPLGYGYYAVVTGYDENGDLIYLQGNTPVQGEYQAPAQDLPYVFLGWDEDKDATLPSYASVEDIEANLSLTSGETTTLYAIWQHATNITFDGNGADGGPGKPDIFIAAGKSTWLQNTTSGGRPAYTKSGHYFTGWNTEPDGSGTNYIDTSFIAPIDKSENLTLYAQWQRYTTVSFDGNGSDGGSGKSDRYLEVGSTIYLCNNDSYTKTGSTFSGWNTAADGSGTAYADCAGFTAPSEPEDITLYAQWEEVLPVIDDLTYMQDFASLSEAGKTNVLNSMNAEQQYQLKDSRDQKDYYISKLADNNIWMTQNLDLNIEAGRTYTSADTDLANSTIGTTWTPTSSEATYPTGTTTWNWSNTAPESYDPGELCWNGTPGSGTTERCNENNSHYHLGNYYNWTAAVAMSNSDNYTIQTDVDQSICPAGWTSPKSGNKTGSGSFAYLIQQYSSNITWSEPLYFSLSGAWQGHLGDFGNRSNYWSSVGWFDSLGYLLTIVYNDGVYPVNIDGRNYGFSLRCVAR